MTVDEWSIHEAKVETEIQNTDEVPHEVEPTADTDDNLSQAELDLKTEPLSNENESTVNIIAGNVESSTEPKSCILNEYASITPSTDEHCQEKRSSSKLVEPEPELSPNALTGSSNQCQANEIPIQTSSSVAGTSVFSSVREKLDQYRAAVQQLSQVARAVMLEPSCIGQSSVGGSINPSSSSLGTEHTSGTLGEGSDRKLYVRYSKPGTFNERTVRESIRKFCPVENVLMIDDQSACVVLDEEVTFGIYDSICRELKDQGGAHVEPYAQYLAGEAK